jgi:hypothetical protein
MASRGGYYIVIISYVMLMYSIWLLYNSSLWKMTGPTLNSHNINWTLYLVHQISFHATPVYAVRFVSCRGSAWKLSLPWPSHSLEGLIWALFWGVVHRVVTSTSTWVLNANLARGFTPRSEVTYLVDLNINHISALMCWTAGACFSM